MKRRFFILATLIGVLFSYSVFCQNKKEIYKHYMNGEYIEAINLLNKIQSKSKKDIMVLYWKGLCFNRLGEYEQAIEQFEIALKNEELNDRYPKDIYYEYGQSYFALKKYLLAQALFKRSVIEGYKINESYYYLAYMFHINGDYEEARKSYQKILERKDLKKDFRQLVGYKMSEALEGENIHIMLRKEIIRNKIVPLLEKSYDVDPKSVMAEKISYKIKKFTDELNELDKPRTMINGRIIPPKVSFEIGQSLILDKNVTKEPDPWETTSTTDGGTFDFETTTRESTSMSSVVSTTSGFVKYKKSIKRRYLLGGDFRLAYTRHLARTHPEVYQNDNLLLAPALRNSYEYSLFKKRSSLIFDLEYNYVRSDRNKLEQLDYNSQTVTAVLGNKINYFSFGSSSMKVKRGKSWSFDSNYNLNVTSVLLAQTITISYASSFFMNFFVYTNKDAYNNALNSTASYTIKSIYVLPDVVKYKIYLAFALTFLDSKELRSFRGLERSYNPYIRLTKSFGSRYEISLLFDYIENSSKDNQRKYHASKFGLDFKAKF